VFLYLIEYLVIDIADICLPPADHSLIQSITLGNNQIMSTMIIIINQTTYLRVSTATIKKWNCIELPISHEKKKERKSSS
ncbi:hypothetical protein BLOT_008266, partial [Blomia tropicalis]